MDTKKTQDFEESLSRTKWLALVAALLHKATNWVGGSALTWATVVLMGGFASNLPISDFADVTLLVLLIIFLLALAHFTCKLVTKKSLSTGSLHPLQLTYSDKRLIYVNVIKFLSSFVQCALFIYCFRFSNSNIHRLDWNSVRRYVFSKPHVDPAAAFASLQGCLQSCATSHHFTAASPLQACAQFCFPEQNSTSTTINLQVCSLTFYSLVAITCLLGFLCNLYIFCRVAEFCWLMYSGHPKPLSLSRYHDEVLSRALNIGLVEADEFEEREFMLQGVGEDLVVRNIAPLEVKSQNEDFIKYLLYYPRGVEMVMGMLASENTLQQQTAANMAGFWSSDPDQIEKVGMGLLSRLGEKLGMPGKVAEGAANSFKALAIAWEEKKALASTSEEEKCSEEEIHPSPLLKVYVSRSGLGGPVGGGENMRKSSRSEGAGRGGGGTSQSNHTVAGGHGRSETPAPPAGLTDTEIVPLDLHPPSSPPSAESSATSRGGGQGGAAAADQNISGGQGGGGGGSAVSRSGGGSRGEMKWNVVQKVVDLVANKRLPTLQVYVRALDSFFMSKSVREWLATEEREMYDSIKKKLWSIVNGGDSQRASRNRGHTSVPIDSSIRARTRLLAFSTLDRLISSELNGIDLLKKVDGHLNAVTENYVIWFEEVSRYDELCQKYKHRYGEWRKLTGPGSKWKVTGGDVPPPPEIADLTVT